MLSNWEISFWEVFFFIIEAIFSEFNKKYGLCNTEFVKLMSGKIGKKHKRVRIVMCTYLTPFHLIFPPMMKFAYNSLLYDLLSSYEKALACTITMLIMKVAAELNIGGSINEVTHITRLLCQKAITAYLKNEQLQPFNFVRLIGSRQRGHLKRCDEPIAEPKLLFIHHEM